ncbi:hypothetical protein NE237_026612 [Protea cynaroides]|uniref:Uncharacterized protein n=1 Tax=Protea cynaroides TaxID=273540 RepID=A0A9Q0H6G8_9MAGN|nr:hypothetical protein NE237_026612 [Protea cynaroides]
MYPERFSVRFISSLEAHFGALGLVCKLVFSAIISHKWKERNNRSGRGFSLLAALPLFCYIILGADSTNYDNDCRRIAREIPAVAVWVCAGEKVPLEEGTNGFRSSSTFLPRLLPVVVAGELFSPSSQSIFVDGQIWLWGFSRNHP